MNFPTEVKQELRKKAIGCAVCALLVFLGFALFDEITWQLALGCVVGYLLAIGNFFFMGIGIMASLDTGEEQAAKKKLNLSYALRTFVILAVLAGSILLDINYGLIRWIPVAAGVFYIRVCIAAETVWGYLRINKSMSEIVESSTPAPTPVEEDEDEEEKEDEFDKFVSHFAKGPIPGSEKADDGKNPFLPEDTNPNKE